MFAKVENFGIESKSKKDFEKGDIHIVITIESTTIVLSILVFQPKIIPMFFHMDSKVLFTIRGLLPLVSSSLMLID
jgi:hypothetical protein